jgi:hypothetical protein
MIASPPFDPDEPPLEPPAGCPRPLVWRLAPSTDSADSAGTTTSSTRAHRHDWRSRGWRTPSACRRSRAAGRNSCVAGTGRPAAGNGDGDIPVAGRGVRPLRDGPGRVPRTGPRAARGRRHRVLPVLRSGMAVRPGTAWPADDRPLRSVGAGRGRRATSAGWTCTPLRTP